MRSQRDQETSTFTAPRYCDSQIDGSSTQRGFRWVGLFLRGKAARFASVGDQGVDLYYRRASCCDPQIGRFTSEGAKPQQ